MLFLKYKLSKLKLRVFLADQSVAMVTYCVTKLIPTCLPVIGQFFDTMIVASSDNKVIIRDHQNLRPEFLHALVSLRLMTIGVFFIPSQTGSFICMS